MDQERPRSLREVLTERGVEGEGASLAFLGSGTKTLVTQDPKEERGLLSMTLAKLAEVGKAVWEGSVPGQAYKWSEANLSPRAMLDSLIGGVEKNVNLEGPIPELTGAEKDKLFAMAEGIGFSGGMLRKVAVKDLATTARGIIKVAEGATDPIKGAEVRSNMLLTLKEVIPAARKVGQEWWDSISGASWKFFKDAETHGDFAADTTKAVRFSPYGATERTVFHEVPAHGGQYGPPEVIKKALVPYKGELVPATEVLDYMTQVSRAWRKYPDYMETLYAKDPTEMHARLVAKDMASGISAEEAFLTRLPKVVKAFELENPQVAERYLTPTLSKVTERVERRLMEAKARGELPKFPTGERLVESRGGTLEAPMGKAEGSLIERELKKAIVNKDDYGVNTWKMIKELPEGLQKFVKDEASADRIRNFDPSRTEPTVLGVAPPAKNLEQFYRPANQLSDGTVVWNEFARTHKEALTANFEKAKGKSVVSSGGLDPEGNYWEFKFLGDEIPEPGDFLQEGSKDRFAGISEEGTVHRVRGVRLTEPESILGRLYVREMTERGGLQEVPIQLDNGVWQVGSGVGDIPPEKIKDFAQLMMDTKLSHSPYAVQWAKRILSGDLSPGKFNPEGSSRSIFAAEKESRGSFAQTYPTFEGYAARMKEMGIPLELLAKEKAKSISRFVNVPASEEEYLERIVRERLGVRNAPDHLGEKWVRLGDNTEMPLKEFQKRKAESDAMINAFEDWFKKE